MTDQFEYAERVKTLVNVRRGWTAMSTKESAKQFKRYLEEYAANFNDRVTPFGYYNWKVSATLLVTAKFLQSDIYVLGQPIELHLSWHC